MRRRLLIILFYFIPLSKIIAQHLNERDFDLYTTASGLSHNYVNFVVQDSTGYVWSGTSAGLNSFNGTRFTQYHSSSDSSSLAAEDVWSMAWLDKHRLGFFTAGIHIIDTRTGKKHNLFIPYHRKQFQFKFNMIERAMAGDSGNFYVLTRSGFYEYDKNYNLLSRFDFYSEQEVPVTHFYFGRGLLTIDKDRLLIVSIGGLYIYEKKIRKLRKLEASDSPLLAEFLDYPHNNDYQFFETKPGKYVVLKSFSDSAIYIDFSKNKKVTSRLPLNPIRSEFSWRTRLIPYNDTTYFITGHNSGFFRMIVDPSSGHIKMLPEKYFQSYLVTGMMNDRDNNLWISTNRGLFRQNPKKYQVQVTHLPKGIEDQFPNIRLDDIVVDGDKVYAGARGEGGLFIFDKKTLQINQHLVFTKNGPESNHIRAIAKGNNSQLLFGTNGPPLVFDELTRKVKELKPPEWVRDGDWVGDVLKDKKGNVWIASRLVYKYELETGRYTIIPSHPELLSGPTGLEEDTAGNIWMFGHGLARYNTKANKYDILLDSFPFIKMADKQVNAMVIDKQNTIWFNCNNNGLIGYNIDKKTYRHITTANGLPDVNMGGIIAIGNKLWIACFSGLACLDLETSQIRSFGKEDGFPDLPFTKGMRFYYDQPSRQLYLAYSTAVVRFNPDQMLMSKPPPRTFIESLVVDGRQLNFLPGETVNTTWKDNEIRLTIGTINFSDGNVQRFAYRIVKDSNTPWTLIGNQPSFSISNLAPGTHWIQVKTFAANNRWPEQVKNISIIVSPPFWKREWFIGVVTVLIIVSLYFFIHWRTESARKKEMEKTHIEKLKADDYKNQFELEQITNYFSSSLAGKKTEYDVLWDVAQNLIGRMNYEDCVIYMWNEEKTAMVQKAAYGPKGKPEIIDEHKFEVMPGQGIVGTVIRTSQPILVGDTRTDIRYRVDDEFRLSEVCVPIIHNDELLGAIDSENSAPNYFSERDIKILTTIATLIGNKLKQIESENTLDAKRMELANTNQQLAEARLSALQAQMNPHFVFNALNSIKRMILEGDNEKASRYLSKFALMIRMTLNHSKETFVTLDENIAYLKAYLEMEQLRFDESFSYSIQTGENIDGSETTIPSMMIQPLVENAIWHGLMQAEDDKNIKIHFSENHNKITCIIEDNGIGIRQSEKQKMVNKPPHHSVGLENLQKRIKIMNEKYNMGCSLEIIDLKEAGLNGSGTRVVLKFNMINA